MYNNKPWIKNITEQTLPNEDLKIVASTIGLDATIKLMCELPGIIISIPKNATLPARIAYIKEHYDGSKKSRLKLVQTCELSESYIYKIIKNK